MQHRFDIVVLIDESKDTGNMNLEELQGPLEAHELRMNERSLERSGDQALEAQLTKKRASDMKKWKKGKTKPIKSGWISNQEKSKGNHRPESSNKRGGSSVKTKEGSKCLRGKFSVLIVKNGVTLRMSVGTW